MTSSMTTTFLTSGDLSSTFSSNWYNASTTYSTGTPGSSGVTSSIPLSTFASSSTANGSSQVSSSARWTNTSCTPWVTMTSSDILGTGSSTFTVPAASTTGGNLTTSSWPSSITSTLSSNSTSSAPFSNSTSTGLMTSTGLTTGSGSTSSDTCWETPTPTPTPTPTTEDGPCETSASYVYGNPRPTSSAAGSSVTNPAVSVLSVSSQPLPASNATYPTFRPTPTSLDPSQSSCIRTPSNGAIENGDFENGLSPWSIDLVDVMSTGYEISTPGADGSCGAFHVAMGRNSQTDDLRANLRLVSPLTVVPPAGTNWTLSFWTRFHTARGASFLELLANEAVAHRVNASDDVANWSKVQFPINAGDDRMLQFVFSFVLGDGVDSNEIWIDKVAIAVNSTTS
ncbi:hypothetical protein F5B19DRAFT_467637 [Rostrohypoxylon terebratum]|nr:hypothetical protein F5B19DRAFT_467637 [Rostrohypoxylon terebratum]